jgi:DNA-binding LytR/AlgR family response regulator
MIWKAVIVDDEPMASSFLQKYCEKHGSIEVLAVFHHPEEASDFLKQTEIDILFLDVEMPGSTGFQLLDILPYMPKVVLTTSKTDYAFDAFQYHVSDYLKKPFTYVRFQEAVNKIIHATGKPAAPAEKPHEDIFIKADGKLTRLNLNDILYIESMGDYVKYFTLQKNYLTLSTLKSVESKMTNKAFMKVHRSFIVNLKKIKDIQDYSLVIEGKVIPISKNLKSEVLERINVV